MIMEEDLKEYINKHIELIKNLSSLSNVQLIAFVNILSVNNPEMFNTLKDVTEWESKILSEFMKESGQTNEKKKKRPKKKPKKESKRASEDMFEPSQYVRIQIGGEKKINKENENNNAQTVAPVALAFGGYKLTNIQKR